jgi:hypothetical protein
VLETLVTNVEQEAHAFGQAHTAERAAGVVYGPLSSNLQYLVTSDEDWKGLAAMQNHTPVSLTYPHGAAQFVCVVGEQVVWEGEPSPEMSNFEPALRRFALAADLAFVELAFAPTSHGICVIAVEPYPHLEHFGAAAQKHIVERIVHLLTAEIDEDHKGVVSTLQRRAP